MEAPQGVELTGTNRPSGLASTFLCVMLCVHCAVPGIRPAPPHRQPAAGPRRGLSHLHRVSVAMAKGKHPVPFRTRKLSPSAPMVLRGGPRGRVGRRRTPSSRGRSPTGSGLNCVTGRSSSPVDQRSSPAHRRATHSGAPHDCARARRGSPHAHFGATARAAASGGSSSEPTVTTLRIVPSGKASHSRGAGF